MSIKRSQIEETNQGMCKACMLFFGSEAYQGFCSSCFKYICIQPRKNKCEKKQEIIGKVQEGENSPQAPCRKDTSDTIEEHIQQPKQVDRKRCFDCKKKVGLLGLECKCGLVFCNSHRLPEDHSCTFNFEEDGKKKLQKEIVKVYNGKIAQI